MTWDLLARVFVFANKVASLTYVCHSTVSHSLSFEERVFYRFPSDQLIMLYPLLKWDTSFPAGFSGETVDLLLKDASSRTLRARTEVMMEISSTKFAIYLLIVKP